MHLYFSLNNTLLLATYWNRGKCAILMGPTTCLSIKIFLTPGEEQRERKKRKTHEKSTKKTKKSFSYFSNLILFPLLSVVSRIMAIMIIVKRLHWLQSAREAILKVNKEKWDISLLELWFSLLSPLLKIFPLFFLVCRSTNKLPLSKKHSQNQEIPVPKCFSAPVL